MNARSSVRTTRRFRSAAARLLPLLLLFAAGCAGQARQASMTVVQPFSAEELALRETAREARYRLRKGDLIRVDFKYQDSLDQTGLRILPDGTISMAGMDVVPVAGMTIEEVDALITGYFAREYRNPDLTVIVQEIGPMQVYVLGEVDRPGLYTLPLGGKGALQAIAAAGGFKPDAASGETVVIRVTEEGFEYNHVDLSSLEKRSNFTAAMFDLDPYDIVYVPRTAIGDFAYFTKNVLGGVLDFSSLFWDIYALMNIEKVDRIVR